MREFKETEIYLEYILNYVKLDGVHFETESRDRPMTAYLQGFPVTGGEA